MINKDDIIITEVAGEYVAVPVGDSVQGFKGIIRLNQTGKDIFEGLLSGSSEDQIADLILDKYEITDREAVLEYIYEIRTKLQDESLLN